MRHETSNYDSIELEIIAKYKGMSTKKKDKDDDKK